MKYFKAFITRCVVLILFCNLSFIPIYGLSPKSVLLNRIEKSFNQERFDDCIVLYYNLIHSSRLESDFFSESKYWYHSAWLYLLNENYPMAESCRHMAKITLSKIESKNYAAITLWENIYLGIYHYKTGNYSNVSYYLKDNCLDSQFVSPRISLLLKLYLLDKDVMQQNKNASTSKTIDFIQSLKHGADTLNFIYPLSKAFLGFSFLCELKYNESIKSYSESIECYNHLKIKSVGLIRVYNALLTVLYNSNKNNDRDQLYQTFLKHFEEKQLPARSLTEFYLLKGNLHFTKFEYQEALDAYLNSSNYSNKSNLLQQTFIFERVFQAYSYLSTPEKLIDWVQLHPDIKLNIYQQSVLLKSKSKSVMAIDAENLIRNIELQLKPESDQYIQIVWNLSQYYEFAGNYGKSELYNRCATQWYLKYYGILHRSTALAYQQKAIFLENRHRPVTEIMNAHQYQLYSIVNEPFTTNFFQLPDVSKSINDKILITTLFDKAQTFNQFAKTETFKSQKIKFLEAALDHYNLAFEVALKYKLNLPKEEQKMLFSDFSRKYYKDAVEILHQLYELTGNMAYSRQMFEYTEKSKSSLLLSMVRGVKGKKLHLIPDSLSEKEENIRSHTELLVQTRAKAYANLNPDYAQIDRYNASLYHLQQEQDSLFALYKKKFPAYYNTKFNSEVINVDSLQKKLNPSQTLVQYLAGKSVLTTFVVTRYAFKVFRQPIDSGFYKKVEAYHQRLVSFTYDELKDSAIRLFARQSHELYTLLLAPVMPYCKGKNLVIIPDDVLTQLPFETLVTELPQTTKKPDYRDLAYLVKTHPVSYDYSATLFVMNGGHETIKNPTLLAMAPSYKNLKIPDISQKDVLAMRGDTGNISTISGTYDEVNSIRKIFGGKSLVKSDATEEKFKKMALNYDVLHLAMHGIVNNEYPMFSKLVFTHAGDSANEGFLNTYEIYNLKINAALVVLSACNSGNGKLYNGEGIISLARGFFTAGAKSVVMTLWSIADKTSQHLMTSFYANLADRLSISDALQKAKTDYIAHSDALMAHPYFWAGFIVTGNSTTTFEVTKSKNQVYWGTLGIVMLCLFGYAGWKWKNH